MGFEGFPFIIGWELTLTCNLRCNHCGSSAGLSRENELTFEESLDICDQFPNLLVQEVNFTGGEPLMSPNWFPIARYLALKGIPAKILTNGLNLNTDTIKKMLSVNIAGVGVSIDGIEKTHDFIRGRSGVFLKAIAGIRETISAGIPVGIITAANALNVGELPALMEFFIDLGLTRWQIQPIFPLGRAVTDNSLRLTHDAYFRLGEFVKNYEEKAAENGLDILPGDSFGYFSDFDTREPAWHGCPAGLYSCGITSDGKIKGCLSLPDHLNEGDLRQNDLWDIWFSPQSFTYTRQDEVKDFGPNCRFCEKAEQCRGGCSAMSYGSTGRFHNDPYCFLTLFQNTLMQVKE